MPTQANLAPVGVQPSEVALSSIEVAANFSPRFGGLPNSLAHLALSLRTLELCSSKVAAFGGSSEYTDTWPELRTSDFPSSRHRWITNSRIRERFARLISDADISHIHGIWQAHSQFTASAARSLRKPYVVSAHGMLESWALKQKRLKKWLYASLCEKRNLQGATYLRALTHAEADDYRRFGLNNKVAVVPNGVEIPHSLSSEAFLERFSGLRGKTLILFMGRIHPKKGIDLLCHAWGRIARDYPDAHLVIAGPDFDRTQSKLEELIRSSRAPQSVTFTGILSGHLKWSALAAAHAFVLPSHSEGFSMAILEALGSGLPVIATHQCNFPEIATAHCGWLIQPDAKSLEISLCELLGGYTKELHSMGDRGRNLVQSRFTWPIVAAQISGLYRSALGDAPPSSVEIR